MPDFIMNGQAHGDVAQVLLDNNFDIGLLRPWKGDDNRSYCLRTKNQDGKIIMARNTEGRMAPKPEVMVTNSPSTLRKDEWRLIDAEVMAAVYTTPTRMWNDLRAKSSVISIPNAMGAATYEYQRASDVNDAITSMDGINEGDSDRQHFDLTGVPLPIIHKDFHYTAREISIGRQKGMPLDTTNATLSARKCMEQVEKYTAGSQTFTYNSYSIQGYTNFTPRLTQSITAPSSSNHATTIAEVLSMRKKLTDAGFYGPFVVYASTAWDLFLDEDYSTLKGQNTLRQRLLAIDGISDVRTSYYLTGNALVMVQLTPDVARPIVGMDVVTLQWPTQGGMQINFKVMCILIPNLRSDFNGLCGICHGS